MYAIIGQCKEKKAIDGRVYGKEPLTKRNYESIEAILNFKDKQKKISKRSIECFNEIAEIAWFPENNIVENEGIHQFLRARMRQFRDSETGKLYCYEECKTILKQNYK